MSLPIDRRPRWKHTLPLILPACFLALRARRLRITHIHSHSCANSAIICMMVSRLTDTPFSLTLNANLDWWGGAMLEKFQEAEFTVTIARWLYESIRRDFPSVRPEQALLAPVGVDTHRWVPEARPENRTPEPFRVVSVGRLHASKGHDDVIRAIGELTIVGRDVTLDIIGDGPERLALERQAQEAGLTDRVTFHGSLGEDQIIEHLRHAHVFALASHAEPLGVVYMEAMAMEVPTIGTAAGGVGEIITDGESGLLVPPQDPAAMAAAIARLIDDPSLCHRIARAGRRAIVERFDSRIGAEILHRKFCE
jgi:glycosyltransferase involved in cell wall biosynthesis